MSTPVVGIVMGSDSDLPTMLGAAEALPWVDGVIYLGRDPRAPSLLLPNM